MFSVRLKNVLKYMVPAMLSNICILLFTIVDGVFVGKGVGADALGAVNIAFPVIMIQGSCFLLATIGGVTVSAIRFGRNDKEGANEIFMHSFFFTFLIGAVFTLIGCLFSVPICRMLGANDTFLKMASDYMYWYLLFSIPSGLGICLQGFCRNDDAPGQTSVAVIISAFINIFLDWLFIFPLGWGVSGAAVASGIAQCISFLFVFLHFLERKGALFIHFPKFSLASIKKIIVRGAPEAIAQFATPMHILCLNLVLSRYVGDVGINAFSVLAYIASFAIAIFCGTSEGLQPLFGQSYGAKNEEDMKYYFRVGYVVNILGSAGVIILTIIFSRPVASLFVADEATIRYVVETMPKFTGGLLAMSANVMISSYLYSTKRSSYAIMINILRSFAVNVAVILILPVIFGPEVIWYTFGISEAIVVIFSVLFLKHSERNGIEFKED